MDGAQCTGIFMESGQPNINTVVACPLQSFAYLPTMCCCDRWKLVYLIPLSIGTFAVATKFVWIELLRARYGTDLQVLSSLQTALVNVLSFFLAPVMGTMSDKIGRKPFLLTTLFGLATPAAVVLFHKSLSIETLYGMIVVGTGFGNCATSVLQAYIIDHYENKLFYLGIMYACFAFSFVIGGGGVGTVLKLSANISDIGNARFEDTLSPAAFDAKVDKYVLLSSTICLVLMSVLVIVILCLPGGERARTPSKRGQCRELHNSILYLLRAKTSVKKLALLNILRALAFLAVTANFLEYLQTRFPKGKENVFLSANAAFACVACACTAILTKKIGMRKLIILGLTSYGLINVSYFLIQESFYGAFVAPSIFYGLSIMCNALLDQVSKSLVAPEEVGLLMGSLAQVRSLAVIIFVIPGGFLFKIAEESSKHNGWRWQWGIPWLFFSLFGFAAAMVASTAPEIKDADAYQGGAEDDGELYTKLNDADNDFEGERDSGEVVRRSSSALLEMGSAMTGMVVTVPAAFPDADDTDETLP